MKDFFKLLTLKVNDIVYLDIEKLIIDNKQNLFLKNSKKLKKSICDYKNEWVVSSIGVKFNIRDIEMDSLLERIDDALWEGINDTIQVYELYNKSENSVFTDYIEIDYIKSLNEVRDKKINDLL